MANDELVTLRLPKEFLARADKLVPRLAADDAVNVFGLRASRSAVLRLALAQGIATLEKRWAGPARSHDKRK